MFANTVSAVKFGEVGTEPNNQILTPNIFLWKFYKQI